MRGERKGKEGVIALCNSFVCYCLACSLPCQKIAHKHKDQNEKDRGMRQREGGQGGMRHKGTKHKLHITSFPPKHIILHPVSCSSADQCEMLEGTGSPTTLT